MPLLIAANWKMHGLGSELDEICAISKFASSSGDNIDVLICVPGTLISRAAEASAGRGAIGGEDCDPVIAGPFTGDGSAEMLKDAGASAVIVGHWERRQKHQETDAMVSAKAKAAWRAGHAATICIGETKKERDTDLALEVCGAQLEASRPADRRLLAGSAIAYEPLWAIGTGRIPAANEIGSSNTL